MNNFEFRREAEAEAFRKRIEKWTRDLQANLERCVGDGVTIQSISEYPADLKEVRPDGEVPLIRITPQDISMDRQGILRANLSDGRSVLFQIYPQGHEFSADVFNAEGEILAANNSYIWAEFEDVLKRTKPKPTTDRLK